MNFLDTNVFVRYLTGNDPAKRDACEALFDRLIAGSEIAMTNDVIVAEIVFVASSQRLYGMSPAEITSRLRPIIAIPSLRIAGKERVLRALDIYAGQPFLGFEDALIVANLEGSESEYVISYDRHFDRVPEIRRREP